MKKRFICLILAVLITAGCFSGCGNSQLNTTETSLNETTQSTVSYDGVSESDTTVLSADCTENTTPGTQDYYLDDELVSIIELGICTKEDLQHLNESISALTFYDILLDSVRLNKLSPVPESIERRNELGDYPIDRREAADWIFYVVLENYFGEKLSNEPWRFDPFAYVRTLSQYHDRCGEALACMEHKLHNEGIYDAGWSGGVSYCAMQLDPYSIKPIMEVDEEGYFRSKEILTKEEAYRAIYRTYRSYLFSESLTLDEIEPLELTEEQSKKALQMPSAFYDNLPDWRGIELANKTHAEWAPLSCEMFTRDDFEILNDLGFNFSRIFITHKFLYDLTDGVKIDSKHLNNMDDAIGYAIENGIHICICLYDFPGFAGASMDATGFYNTDQLQNICDAYEFLAKRYQNVPNNVLSFNLFNEPWLITKEEEPHYVDAVHAVSDVIWKYSKERLIFIDGIAGSQKPVESLGGEPYAQAFHMYGPEQFIYSSWVGGISWYQAQQWPLPYANGMLDSERTLTLQGDFPIGTRIELMFVGNDNGTLTMIADEKISAQLQLENEETNDGIVMTLGVLETSAKELILKWNGNIVQFESLAIIFPEKTEKGIPLNSSPWAAEEDIRHELVYEKMTVIYCDAWCLDGNEASTLVIANDGTYSNPSQVDLCYDQEYLREWIEPWLEFRKKYGNDIMIQEWGMVDIVSDEGGRAYLKDWVELFNLYDIPWNKWGEVLNTEQLDVEYEEYRGYLLNRGMIEALMTDEVAKKVP